MAAAVTKTPPDSGCRAGGKATRMTNTKIEK
jgi:hypothetical protein